MSDRNVRPPQPAMSDRSVRPPQPAMSDRSVRPPQPAMSDRSVRPPKPAMSDRNVRPPQPAMSDRSVRHPQPAMSDRNVRPPQPAMSDRNVRHPQPAMSDRSVQPPQPAVCDRCLLHRQPAVCDRCLLHRQVAGLFEAANREFETVESRSDASEISGELPTEERISPGETASDLETVVQDSAGPDTRLQVEAQPTSTCSFCSRVREAVKMTQYLMEKSGMDLLTVTQALLKNSGDAEATLHFLQTGQRPDGYPVWTREDDLELQKDDESERNKLISKFGAENVAKRVAFRKS